MNKIFKVIWNSATQSWVAVSELSKVKGKSSSSTDERVSPTKTLISLSVAGGVLLGGSAFAAQAIGTNAASTYVETTTNNVLVGQTATASARGVAVGIDAQATGVNATVVGLNSAATATNAMAFGFNATASGGYSIAMGDGAKSSRDNDIAVGANSQAAGGGSIAFGAGSKSTHTNNTAIGTGAFASEGESTAIGKGATAFSHFKSRSGTAIGNDAIAAFARPGAGGFNTKGPSSDDSYRIGGTAIGSHAIAGAADIVGTHPNNANPIPGLIAIPTANENTGWLVYERAGMYRSDANGVPLYNATTAKAKYEADLAALVATPAYQSASEADKLTQRNSLLEPLVYNSGQDQTAIGVGARALGDQSIAIGGQSIAGKSSVVLGANDVNSIGKFYLNEFSRLAPGRSINTCCVASYGVEGSTVLGSKASSDSAFGTAIGLGSVVIGNMTSAFGGVAVGSGATVGWRSNGVVTEALAGVAIGMGSQANATFSTALGAAAYAGGLSSTAISYRSRATGISSIAAGAFSNVSGERSMILGANVSALETNNSIVLGTESSQVIGGVTENADGSTQATDSRPFSGASHAVTKVSQAKVRNADGGETTYSGFAGQPKNSGQYVSLGAPNAERQIKNLAAGAIDERSTDAINGSQLYAVTKRVESGFRVAGNGTDVQRILPDEAVNFVDGDGTTTSVTTWEERDADGNVVNTSVNVTFNVNKTPLTNSDTGAVNTPADINAFATAGDVATAINNSGWIVTSDVDGGKRDGAAATKELVKPSEEVKFIAGTNLQIKQDAQNFTYSTVDNPTFANVTANNMTVGGNSPIQIGNKAITGLDNTLPVTSSGDNPTTSQARPENVDQSKAATLGDVLNAGWNLQENGTAKDFVKPYDTITFNNTETVSVNVTSDGNLSNVTWTVNTTPLKNAADGTVTTPAEPNKIATAGDVANAINNSGWRTNATNPTGESKEIVVNPGDLVLFKAGTNLQVEQTKKADNEVEYTYSTVMNPTFANVTANNMTVGGDSPIQIGNKAITGLDNTLPVTSSGENPTTSQARPENVDQTKAATLGDVLNAGWNLQENGTAKDFVKPYDTITFNNTETVSVNVTSDGNLSNVTWKVNTTPLTNAADGTVTTPAEPNKIATAGDVATAINKSGWRTNATNPTGESKEIVVNPGDLVLFKAGTNLQVEQTKKADNEVEYTYSTVMNPTFANVTANNMTVGGSSPIQIGNKAITGLDNTLPVTSSGDNPTTSQARPENVDQTKAATLGDVLNAGWNLQENGAAKDFVKPYDTVNFVNGTGTAVNITSDGNVSVVKVDVVTADVNTNTDPDKAKDEATNTPATGTVVANGTGYVTADTLAKAVNSSGWKVTSDLDGGERDGDDATVELVQPGEEVKFLAGKNLKIKQNGQNFTYSTVDNPTFANVTATNMTVGSDPSKPIEIGTNNGKNEITGLDSTLPTGTSEEPVLDKDGNPVTDAEGNPVTYVSNVTRPTNVDGSKVATLGDLLNTGWNLQENGSARDFVKPYDTVNFVNGTGTAVNITSDGNVSIVKVDVVTGDVNTNTDPNTSADTDNKVPATGQVVANGTGYVTADTLAKAVNSSGWKVTSDITGTGERAGADATVELVQPGEQVKFIAGDNLQITQDGQNFTYATKKDVTFESVKSDTLTLGNASNPATPEIAFNTEKATPTNINSDTDAEGNQITPSSALNLSSNGSPVQLKGVASSLSTSPQKAGNGESVLDLTNADPTAVVTAADLKNYGWIVNTPTDGNNSVVNNADVVNFIGKNGINVTSVANGTNGNWDVVVEAVKPTYTKDNKDSASAISFNNGNGTTSNVRTSPNGQTTVSFDVNQTTGDVNENGVANVETPEAFLNAGNVAKLVNNAGWNVFQNNVTTAKKDTVTAGNNVAFNNGTYTTVNVTSDGTNTTITYDANVKSFGANATTGRVTEGDISPTALATNKDVADAINESGWVTQVNTLDKDGNPVVDANGNPVTSPKVVKPGTQVNYVAGQGTTAKTTVDPTTGALSVSYSVNGTTGNVGDAGTANVADPNAYLNAGEVAKLVNGVSWTVDSKTDATTANAATKNTYKASAKVKAGDTVRINAGRNIEISGEGRNINIATSNDPTFNNVKANKVDANDIVAGNSLTVGTGAGATQITSSPEGLKIAKSDGSPQRILNVAPGVNDTDAVNVSQLKGAIGNVNNRINKSNKQNRAGIAGANAAVGLPQVYIPGKSMVAAAAGSFKGQSAVAVGYSRASDNGKLILKLQGNANTQGDVGGSVGVGYQW